MNRYIEIIGLVFVCIFIIGCQSKAIQMLIEQQEWENFAVYEGVNCTSPEMIDGNPKTVGEVKSRWIHLDLPERKTIHRIIIRGTNVSTPS